MTELFPKVKSLSTLATELAPGTKLLRGVSVEAAPGEVRVYCETARSGTREVSGSRVDDTVCGILEVTYAGTAAAKPQRWRTVNPDIGITEAGASANFTQHGSTLLIGKGLASPARGRLESGQLVYAVYQSAA